MRDAKKIISMLLVVFTTLCASISGVSIDTTVVLGAESYTDRYKRFINDPNWSNNISWDRNQTAKQKEAQAASPTGCAAYAADFVYFMYGGTHISEGGTAIGDFNDICTGDVVHIKETYNKSEHWFVVLERNGNDLYTAEGNYNDSVFISRDEYKITAGNSLTQWGRTASWYDNDHGYHYKYNGTSQASQSSFPAVKSIFVSQKSSTGYTITVKFESDK